MLSTILPGSGGPASSSYRRHAESPPPIDVMRASPRSTHMDLPSCASSPSVAQSVRSVAIEPNSSGSRSYEEYETLGTQFSGFVVVSTFTATLIVSFIQLAHDAFNANGRIYIKPFESGMLIALIGAGFHIGAILVGSRAARLCQRLASALRHAKDKNLADIEKYYPDVAWTPIQEHQEVNFYRYIRYCERMQSMGTSLLILCIHLLTFSMFSSFAFPVVFIAVTVLGYFWMMTSIGFWKLSVLRESLMIIYHKCLGFMRKRREPRGSANDDIV